MTLGQLSTAELIARLEDVKARVIDDSVSVEGEFACNAADHRAAADVRADTVAVLDEVLGRLKIIAKPQPSADLLAFVQGIASQELCDDPEKTEPCHGNSGPYCDRHDRWDYSDVLEARRLLAKIAL